MEQRAAPHMCEETQGRQGCEEKWAKSKQVEVQCRGSLRDKKLKKEMQVWGSWAKWEERLSKDAGTV